MNIPVSNAGLAVTRPQVTLLMVICGIVAAAAAGTVSASTTEDAALSVAVKYDPQSLATDAGAKAVYRRLVKAAETVCPNLDSSSRLVNNATLQCRRQAVARAVHQIDSPRLAAIVAPHLKTG